MIITVTMNPAIDKTVSISKLVPGGLNRITSSLADAGGKGINVSKTVKALGGDTIATGFLGKDGSRMILDSLSTMDIRQDFILVDGETRVNIKVAEADGTITELNEAGPEIMESYMEEFMAKLQSLAGNDRIFVFAGNVPYGVRKDIYAVMTKAVRSRGARVFLDADGDLFRFGIEEAPDFVKPNEAELAQYFNCDDVPKESELICFGKKLLEKGTRLVAISRGDKGVLFITAQRVVQCTGIPVKVKSTVGAGDAMVAALCYAIDTGLSMEEAYQLSVAAATGAVMTPGTKPSNKETVIELISQVKLTVLESL